MNQNALIKQLSKVLCYQSASQNTGYCPHCDLPFEPGAKCNNELAKTFEGEAQAVVNFLLEHRVIKKGKLL